MSTHIDGHSTCITEEIWTSVNDFIKDCRDYVEFSGAYPGRTHTSVRVLHKAVDALAKTWKTAEVPSEQDVDMMITMVNGAYSTTKYATVNSVARERNSPEALAKFYDHMLADLLQLKRMHKPTYWKK